MRKSLAGFIVHMLSSFSFPLTIKIIASINAALEVSLRSYLLKLIIDGVRQYSYGASSKFLILPIVCYFGFLLTRIITIFLEGYFVEAGMVPALRKKIGQYVVSYYLEQGWYFYQNNFAGSLSGKFKDLARSIPDIIHVVLDRFVRYFVIIVFSAYALWHVQPFFAYATTAWILSFFALSLVHISKIRTLSARWSRASSVATGTISDILSNMLSVKLFSASKFEYENASEKISELSNAERSMMHVYRNLWAFYGVTFFVLQAVSIYLLIQGVLNGALTIGDFVLVFTVNTTIASSFWEFVENLAHFSRDVGYASQAYASLTEPIEVKDLPGAREMHVHSASISYEGVSFGYKQGATIFSGLSVTIPAGQKVGLVGYSGGGKTTFVHLILRLYDVDGGSICIGDQNIASVTQESLRASISMIPQDPVLFHRSIRENIRYGKRDASDEEVVWAARLAHMDELIRTLPAGYDTLVGERGVKLSGGQRQRIAMARALLKNAPILILDEATSQLDSITESHIQESVEYLMKGKTTLVIAHRLSTLLQMDRILVFENGTIVEDGSHEQLLARSGRYKDLWDAQVGGFMMDEQEAIEEIESDCVEKESE